nr:patatin-like phospholipase family protein [Bacillus glycinifermentans]
MLEERKGKLGLALSGGGFRAAFFHIGVLTRMADMGLLRHVEVISTVSGGSIIGALYYLRLKNMLEEKQGSEIKDEDYQDMMETIQNEFLLAVQRNIRLRTFLNPLKNLRMCLPDYSRSDYIGELLEKFLFGPVNNCLNMKQLSIKSGVKNAKIPILMMNATVLNSGHKWVFTVSGMGETKRDKSMLLVDGNFKLEKVKSYEDLCEGSRRCECDPKPKQGPCRHKFFRLGHAVAASASVPGVFVPLAISGLYDKGVRVQLVDGGVHDNQGIGTLLQEEPECTHFIISDASKQLENQKEPPTHFPGVMGRSTSILADLVREKQLSSHLSKHYRTTALLHLKRRLPIESIPIQRDYRFFEIEEWLTSRNIDPYYKRLLEAASKTLFKAFRINIFLKIAGFAIMAFLSIMFFIKLPPNVHVPKALLTLAIFFLFLLKAMYADLLRAPAVRIMLKIAPAVFIAFTGGVLIGLYLITIDKLYLYLGSMKRLKRKAEKKEPL